MILQDIIVFTIGYRVEDKIKQKNTYKKRNVNILSCEIFPGQYERDILLVYTFVVEFLSCQFFGIIIKS